MEKICPDCGEKFRTLSSRPKCLKCRDIQLITNGLTERQKYSARLIAIRGLELKSWSVTRG